MCWFKYAAFGAVAMGLLSGCGGGSGGGVSSGLTTMRLGQASVTYKGTPRETNGSGSGSVTVTGMSGAAYSNVSLLPTQSLDNSVLLYSTGLSLSTLTPSGVSTEISAAGRYPFYEAFTHDGHIVFAALDLTPGNFFLYECDYDGSNQVKLFNMTVSSQITGVDWSPNNLKIAWVDSGLKLRVSSPNGSNSVIISSTGINPAFSPDSSTVAFEAPNGGGFSQIYTVPAAGGSPVLVSGQSPSQNYHYPIWMPDGLSVMVSHDSGSSANLDVFSLTSGEVYTPFQPVSSTDQEQPALSPDGKYMAFLSGQYGGSLSILSSQYNGINQTTLASEPNGVQGPKWSPFFAPQTFVGSTGTMLPSASGFLWGQNGDAFASMVCFNASTPNSTTITNQTGASSGELVYDIHAASLTGLKYMNCYYGQITTVIPGSASPQTDALISFNGATGQVATIAPFVASRTAVNPVRQGRSLVYQEQFSGVWDSKGHNLAPQGASGVSIDAKTGTAVVTAP